MQRNPAHEIAVRPSRGNGAPNGPASSSGSSTPKADVMTDGGKTHRIEPDSVEHKLYKQPPQNGTGQGHDVYPVIVQLNNISNMQDGNTTDRIVFWLNQCLQDEKGLTGLPDGHLAQITIRERVHHTTNKEFFQGWVLNLLKYITHQVQKPDNVYEDMLGHTSVQHYTKTSASILFNHVLPPAHADGVPNIINRQGVIKLQIHDSATGFLLYINFKRGSLDIDSILHNVANVIPGLQADTKIESSIRKARIAASVRAIQTRRGTAITETDAAASAEAPSPHVAKAMESLALDGPAAVPTPPAAAPRGTARGLRSPYLF